MLVTLKVVHQIYVVHHHLHLHHHHHHNVNHKKMSVLISALQTYFKLRVHCGFLFSLFVCCVLCNSTSNNVCGCHHYVRAVFFIVPSKYFHSLEDTFFNSVGWNTQSARSLKICFSENIALKLLVRTPFLYNRM